MIDQRLGKTLSWTIFTRRLLFSWSVNVLHYADKKLKSILITWQKFEMKWLISFQWSRAVILSSESPSPESKSPVQREKSSGLIDFAYTRLSHFMAFISWHRWILKRKFYWKVQGLYRSNLFWVKSFFRSKFSIISQSPFTFILSQIENILFSPSRISDWGMFPYWGSAIKWVVGWSPSLFTEITTSHSLAAAGFWLVESLSGDSNTELSLADMSLTQGSYEVTIN